MLNSRDISRLRPDVGINCRKFIEIAKTKGYNVLVTGTVRDAEYQLNCYLNGFSNAKTPSFHSVKAGLAFDICQNIKGKEYNDADFWYTVGKIGEDMGFTWGGRWKAITDMPHFQWDEHKKFTGTMVRGGIYPPTMPVYEDDEEMTYEQFSEYMEKYMSIAGTGNKPSEWAKESTTAITKDGIINGDGLGNFGWQKPITREALATVLHNMK